MPAFYSYTWVICKEIHVNPSCTCAKCQHSSVTYVPYIGRYIDPFLTLVRNASTLHLHMCHKSAGTENH